MIKFLVSVGAGNVGGASAQSLVNNEKYVLVIVDNLVTGSIHKLPQSNIKNFEFIKIKRIHYILISSQSTSRSIDRI